MQKRLLCIISSMNRGGAETFLMKVFRNIEREKYIFDFCLTSIGGVYEDEIEELGGKVFKICEKSKHPIRSFSSIINLVRDYKYDYVIRINEHSLATIDLIAAYLGGARHLIMRSSNSDSGSKFRRLLHKCFKFLSMYVPTSKIAPSVKAGKYTFGSKFEIVHNGLAIDDYKFSMDIRSQYRKEFNIKDKFVVGHVGRFVTQKNHRFLIDVFSKILEKEPSAVLLLVGIGELEQDIKSYIQERNLSEKVIFAGSRDDVNKIYMAMDVFVFPSLYEGMPNTVIEAQTTGLRCIISDTITQEAKMTESVSFISLDDDISVWSDIALDQYDRVLSAKENVRKLKEEGYDIKEVCEKFTSVVFDD